MSFVMAAGAAVSVVGGIMGASSANKAKREAARAQKKAQAEMNAKKKQYEALDTTNLAKDMENKFEDMTINQKGMELQSQKSAQSRANVMDSLKSAAGGSGVAALAQQMANQGSLDAQKSAAMIGDQERANQAKEMEGADALQTAKMQGAKDSRQLQSKSSAISGIGGALIGGAAALSDRKLKKNISKIGESPSGLNIYSFEYIDFKHGEGLFQGVMSDEVPQAVITINGYDAVDYSMLDVEFKNI